MNRSDFLKIGALSGLATCLAIESWSVNSREASEIDANLYRQLLAGNDKTVAGFLSEALVKPASGFNRPRSVSLTFAVLAASYTTSDSEFYHSEAVRKQLETLVSALLELQNLNGTIDAGGNRQSPPDTAFLLEYLCPAAALLRRDDSEETRQIRRQLDDFMINAGEALVKGGVHTPNHRWVVSASLARLYTLYSDERYLERIDQWLDEGVYLDADGQFPERSRNYSRVEAFSLMTIAHLLNRPKLLEIVEKNLISTYYFLEENGELITVDSRRQDQNFLLQMSLFYLGYRYLAIAERNEMLTAVTREIEGFDDFEQQVLSRALIHFLDMPMLLQKLPAYGKLPENYTKYFPLTQVVRIKRGLTTATIFGGNDLPVTVASGRSSNPTFFTYRKGQAILEYARLSTSFFNTGYVRSEGLKKDADTYYLHERKEAYYYQPLPANKRNEEGDYRLSESLDGRFWSKMDFENRPVSDVQVMETDITVQEHDGEFEMNIKVAAAEGVQVTLELCFRSGGKLSNVRSTNNQDDYLLADGYATYQAGTDTIRVGPGILEHESIDRIDGELYSTHFGSIKGEGMHLFLTGYTPFSHTITFK
ncbi:hypothetical protein [Sunxiuqinia dokdonensis]|uniref:Heparin-sulfate lyase N-terminal domain-containing protein n=1 Tax=Sunxiuqinia dokdonensis TaxID=1409788 RepID=A0A0L8VB12_9BACT|nr:hypothetical protein [Sunxiuqinia dokdonensis]KOH45558.1 hypothetical protein NC99_16210 [Sunxiuqinia dokdonensis]